MSDIAKLKKKAADLEQRRQFDRALAVYEEMLLSQEGSDDADVSLLNRVGDLRLRLGRAAEALDAYERAIELYVERGFLNNAIALCNKVLRQDPARADIHYRLGRISAEKGFRSDAKRHFLEYAGLMQRSGRLDEAFTALTEFAELSPEHVEVRLILADQLAKHGRTDDAVAQLTVLLERYEAERRHGDAEAVAARIRALDPEFAPPAHSSGDAAMSADQDAHGGRAFAARTEGSSRTPAGMPELVLIEPAEFGAPAEARPGRRSLEMPETLIRGDAVEMSLPTPSEAMDAHEMDAGLTDAFEMDAHVTGAQEIDARSERVEGLTANGDPSDTLDDRLPEALDGFEATGLHGGAQEHHDPHFTGFPSSADLAPSSELLASGRASGGFDFVLAPSADALREVPPEDAGSEADALLLDDPFLLDVGTSEPHPAESGSSADFSESSIGALPPLLSPPDVAPVATPVHATPVHATPVHAAAVHAAAVHAAAVDEAPGAAPLMDDSVAGDSVADDSVAEALPPDGDIGDVEMGDADELLELSLELDVTTGTPAAGDGGQAAIEMAGDAASYEEDVTSPGVVAPNDPSSSWKSAPAWGATLEVEPASPLETTASTPAAATDDFVNLGDLLRADEGPRTTRMVVEERAPTGDEQADFAEMLQKFKQGVAENVDDSDYESHYDLGVAYKEMGLLDEAVAAFQRALRGTAHRARTYEALGHCFLEREQHAVASAVLQRALTERGADDQQLVGVLYLLGRAAEAMNQRTEALSYYQRVFAVDIEFADVARRMESAGRVQR